MIAEFVEDAVSAAERAIAGTIPLNEILVRVGLMELDRSYAVFVLLSHESESEKFGNESLANARWTLKDDVLFPTERVEYGHNLVLRHEETGHRVGDCEGIKLFVCRCLVGDFEGKQIFADEGDEGRIVGHVCQGLGWHPSIFR